MKYVALLRGINVGGNNKVEMPRLKALFEKLGYASPKTYINSGNVVFESMESNKEKLTSAIEQAIEQEFGFPVKVVVVEGKIINDIAQKVPSAWTNDSTEQRCDVLFLWPEIDNPSILNQIQHTSGVDELVYYPGAVVWRLNRKDYTKSGLNKLIGTEIYKKSTARNINTVRKLAQIILSDPVI